MYVRGQSLFGGSAGNIVVYPGMTKPGSENKDGTPKTPFERGDEHHGETDSGAKLHQKVYREVQHQAVFFLVFVLYLSFVALLLCYPTDTFSFFALFSSF